MSSTGVVAIFIPVALGIEHEAKINRKRLLMPISLTALISGMMTLIATAPNLIVNTALKEKGFAQLSLFSFTPFGVATLAAGVCYILIFGRNMLSRDKRAQTDRQQFTLADLSAIYGIEDRLQRVCVLPNSPLSGKSVGLCRLDER
jgi:di/tricarboxylate transporter